MNWLTDLFIMQSYKFKVRLVEQIKMYNRPKNCSNDLFLMHGYEFQDKEK